MDSDLKYKREESLGTEEIVEAMQQCVTSLNLLIIDAFRVSLVDSLGSIFHLCDLRHTPILKAYQTKLAQKNRRSRKTEEDTIFLRILGEGVDQ